MLDRLAPRIERAQTLRAGNHGTPSCSWSIAPGVSTGDPRYDVRRSVTIERVTEAIKAKDGSPELSSVGQAAPAER